MMSRTERQQLRRAIRLIHGADSYDKGIAILTKLAGMDYPAARIAKKMKPVEISVVAARPNQSFLAKWEPIIKGMSTRKRKGPRP